MKTIDDLTKNELIKIIANICDVVQTVYEWQMWGFSKEDAEIIEYVGRLCKDRCYNTKDWTLISLNNES